MAAKKVTRATAKKMKDKWRAKQWYSITAPDIFDNKEMPETPADEPSKLMGRTVEVTMHELTNDFSKSNIKVSFRINKIVGLEAKTTFIGHEFTSDYIRRLTRRRRTKVDGVFDVTTKDGYRIRVKPMAIAEHRIQSSQKSAIRKLMKDIVLKMAREQVLGEFVRSMIGGELSRNIFQACKPIYRLKRVDIRKSEVLGQLSTHKNVEKEPEDIDKIPEEPEPAGEDEDVADEAVVEETEIDEEPEPETPVESIDEEAEPSEPETPAETIDEVPVPSEPAEDTVDTSIEDHVPEVPQEDEIPETPDQDEEAEPAEPEEEIKEE